MGDILGKRGEALFNRLITESHPGQGSIFDPHFLGDKYPCVDFIVTLQGVSLKRGVPVIPFFFVQVKATRQGYTKRGEKRLKVSVSQARVIGLASYPAPTYVVGIDDDQEIGYIVSANGENLSALSSLSAQFPIASTNRQRLWDEVQAYWNGPSVPKLPSALVDTAWR